MQLVERGAERVADGEHPERERVGAGRESRLSAQQLLFGGDLAPGNETAHWIALGELDRPRQLEHGERERGHQRAAHEAAPPIVRPGDPRQQHRQHKRRVQVRPHGEPAAEHEPDAVAHTPRGVPAHGGPRRRGGEEDHERVVAGLLSVPNEERHQGPGPRRRRARALPEEAGGERGEDRHECGSDDGRRQPQRQLGLAEQADPVVQQHLQQRAVVVLQHFLPGQRLIGIRGAPGQELIGPQRLAAKMEEAKHGGGAGGEPDRPHRGRLGRGGGKRNDAQWRGEDRRGRGRQGTPPNRRAAGVAPAVRATPAGAAIG